MRCATGCCLQLALALRSGQLAFQSGAACTLLVEGATNVGVACSRFLRGGRGLLREGGRLLPLLLEHACAARRRILQLDVSGFGLLSLHEVRRGAGITLFGFDMLRTRQRDSRRRALAVRRRLQLEARIDGAGPLRRSARSRRLRSATGRAGGPSVFGKCGSGVTRGIAFAYMVRQCVGVILLLGSPFSVTQLLASADH